MPCVKSLSYNLRKETCFKPKINSIRFKNSFINRLAFKYELAVWYYWFLVSFDVRKAETPIMGLVSEMLLLAAIDVLTPLIS